MRDANAITNDLRDTYFGFKGRFNRARYWRHSLLAFAVAGALQLLVIYMFPIPESLIALFHSQALEKGIVSLVMAAPSVTFVYISSAISVKRLHDRNKPGWWALFYLGLPSLVLFAIVSAADPQGQVNGWPAFLIIPYFILLIVTFVELACLKGTTGPNMFGPDPLAAHIPAPHASPPHSPMVHSTVTTPQPPTTPVTPPISGG